MVHAIAGIDAFAAIDAAVVDSGLARINFDDAGTHAIAAFVAAVRAAGVVADMQGLACTEAVLPNPVDTGEATPEVADKGDIQQDDQDKNKIDIVQRTREARIRAPGHEGPYGSGGVEVEQRHYGNDQ